MGLRNPYYGLVMGALLFLASFSGSTQVVDERVVVPANGYLEWPVQMYPGQALRAGASVITGDVSEAERGVLELLVMDDEDFAYYESGDYGRITEWTCVRIGENRWDSLEVNARWFGRVHVVLNNRIRAVGRDTPKDAGVSVSVLRPVGYLGFPGVVLMGVSLPESYAVFRRRFKR